jgi:hypothetical protein
MARVRSKAGRKEEAPLGLPLEIDLKDFDPELRQAYQVSRRGGRVLGSAADALARRFIDDLPRVVAERLAAMAPAGMQLSEVQLKFLLEAKIPGLGAKGEVTAKFAPKA